MGFQEILKARVLMNSPPPLDWKALILVDNIFSTYALNLIKVTNVCDLANKG